jgi:endonuclease G, mitochondrial
VSADLRFGGIAVWLPVLAIGLGACGHAGSAHPRPAPSPVSPGPGLVLGQPPPAREVLGDASVLASEQVPFGAPMDADPSDDYLMDKGTYVLSYNPRRNVANWVGWRVRASNLGSVKRQNDFRADPSLPDDYYKVVPKDYAHSGFDRGHFCPSADRSRTEEGNSSTFLMTNMHPQRPSLNRGPWKKLEDRTRRLVKEGKDAYVLAGGLFSELTIGHGVAVPSASYKVVVVVEAGQGLSDVTAETMVLSVVMPNDDSVRGKAWESFGVSVRELEKRSGYNLLSRLDDAVEEELEAREPAAPQP